ncbi:hypothetical protein B0T20DRAFT_26578 [Sordaria brevicollis]|uniref:Uncharacterized protein n=1 Tax=Sordaria brevicollis TaxID=83679 RepID=A0AAE0UGJ2_SORBR|nr:hypothetical protein B0T20DRAFT_26578 [Sordaria brevicollis]
MCQKLYRQRIFCPGDTHKQLEIIRPVSKNATSLSLLEYLSEDDGDEIDNANNSGSNCDCERVITYWARPVVDYALEAICEGCIAEEREMVERVLGLKRAIAEMEADEEAREVGEEEYGSWDGHNKDGKGYGEAVPFGMMLEGGYEKFVVDGDGDEDGDGYEEGDEEGDGYEDAAASNARLARARDIYGEQEAVSGHEPEYPNLEGAGKSADGVEVLPSPVAKDISAPGFVPVDNFDERWRRESVGGKESSSHVEDQYARCKCSSRLIEFKRTEEY